MPGFAAHAHVSDQGAIWRMALSNILTNTPLFTRNQLNASGDWKQDGGSIFVDAAFAEPWLSHGSLAYLGAGRLSYVYNTIEVGGGSAHMAGTYHGIFDAGLVPPGSGLALHPLTNLQPVIAEVSSPVNGVTQSVGNGISHVMLSRQKLVFLIGRKLHAVGTYQPHHAVVATLTGDGQTWDFSTPVDTGLPAGSASIASLYVNPGGSLSAVYKSSSDNAIRYAECPDLDGEANGTWTSVTTGTTNTTAGIVFSHLIDRKGRCVIVFGTAGFSPILACIVGTLDSAGAFSFSAAQTITSGADVQGVSLIELADGTLSLATPSAAHRLCRALADDATGTWDSVNF